MCCFVIFTWTFSETVIYQNKYFFCLYIKQKIIAYESLICTSAWTNNKNVQFYLEHLTSKNWSIYKYLFLQELLQLWIHTA